MIIYLDSGLVGTGNSAPVLGDNHVLIVKKVILLSLPSHLCGHIKQYNIFAILCDSAYDSSLGFLAYSRS